MVTTQLPTKTEYEKAMDELKQINDDLFYDDFREKIKLLESNLLQLAMSSTSDFKKEAEHVISRASLLFRQLETQKQEVRELLEANQSETIQRNQEFLEDERTRLLFVYEELQKGIQLFTEQTDKLQQSIASSNKELLDKTITSIESISSHVTEFTERLSDSDKRNRQFLEQNEAFVTLTKGQLTQTEEKLAAHVESFQKMEHHLEQLHASYEDMFHRHTESIKTIMVVREEVFIDKVTHQLEQWTVKQSEQGDDLQKQIDSLINIQSKQSHEMLESISNKMSSKEDLAIIEKKSARKINLLLSVAVIEAILIGIKFFI